MNNTLDIVRTVVISDKRYVDLVMFNGSPESHLLDKVEDDKNNFNLTKVVKGHDYLDLFKEE